MNWLDIFPKLGGERREIREDSGLPLFAVIADSLSGAIQSGRLAAHAKLPTNRELAQLLKVDRSTVSRAYAELTAKGLIESHVGRGTYVLSTNSQPSQEGSIPLMWADKFSRSTQSLVDLVGAQPSVNALDPDSISFSSGLPTEEFYPYDDFASIVGQMLKQGKEAEMFGYSPAQGHPKLLREVRHLLSTQGISASEDELLITSGSQQAIDLVTNIFVDPDDIVVLEEPTYLWAIGNFKARQARCLPVPIEADGMDVAALESLLKRHKPKLIYTMPSFQNPTGATMSLSKRIALVNLARQHQVPLLEDSFVGDLRYDGQALPPLRALPGGDQVVIHQATASKALCPGLRLGWVVAPLLVSRRLHLAKRASDLSTNSLAQLILAAYLRDGLYSKHLDAIRGAYRARRIAIEESLSKHFNTRSKGKGAISWTRPEGGMFIWLNLPEGYSAREFLSYAERERVTFSSGDLFYFTQRRAESMRLCFIQNQPEIIEEGVRRLAKAWRTYTERVSAAQSGSEQTVLI